MMKKLIRESVFTIDLYEPGKSVETLKRELGLEKEFSKLASNENPLGPSPLAIETIKKSLADCSLYPDGSCHDLKKKIAGHLGILPGNLGVGNGTTELILFIGLAFLNPEETLIISKYSFLLAKRVAQVIGSKLIEVPLKEYRHDLDAILEAVTGDTKMVYLDNPMNPIGTLLAQREVSRFMERIPEDILVVFDEAYYEYVSEKNCSNTLKFIEEGRNVIVLRTFSKMYGLAGLRIGYCITNEYFVDAIKRVIPPLSVNRFAQIGAAAALEDEKHVKKTRKINESGKKYLYENFEKMSVFYVPSETNFVTFDVKTDAKKVSDELQKRGVIIRPLTMYGMPTFLRMTIGTPDQNKKFVDAFRQVYRNL